MGRAPRSLARVLLPVALALGGCALEEREAPARRPADVRAQVAGLLPPTLADRAGWAADIHAAMTALGIATTGENLCAVLAVTEQESTFRADPPVANLSRIAWEEIDRRLERLGIPKAAVHLALRIDSPDGRTYAERLDAVRTEKELSGIFEDFIGMVPMGQRLFGRLNPVRTGGPMQVSIAFAERHAKERPYPYAMTGSIRHEVFTRRGGLYFGIAHLLGYPADYPRHLYRFADFNAGHYASRNAAFQSAVSLVSGIPLALDGDLVVPGGDGSKPGSTELAVRSIGKRLELSHEAIREALEQGDAPGFGRTALYRRVFEQADRLEGKAVPRAVVPHIPLKSPKITRPLTTQWFADRVQARNRQCLAKLGGAEAAAREPPTGRRP